jgi:hypothetical protein
MANRAQLPPNSFLQICIPHNLAEMEAKDALRGLEFAQPVNLDEAQTFVGARVQKGAGRRASLGQLSSPVQSAPHSRAGGYVAPVTYTVTYASHNVLRGVLFGLNLHRRAAALTSRQTAAILAFEMVSHPEGTAVEPSASRRELELVPSRSDACSALPLP